MLGPVSRYAMVDGNVVPFLAEDAPLTQLRLKFYDGVDTPNATPNKDIWVEVIDNTTSNR
jgi:hypothetical protein